MLDAAFQIRRGSEQMTSFPQQRFSGFGQASPVAAAVEQFDVEVLLKLLYGVGDSGGYAMQFLARGRKTAVTGNGIQNQQCVQ
jgi:hypothetical protein